MKLTELLTEATSEDVKKLNVEFKEIAAKYGITLKAGMGWPRVNAKEAWYGGGLSEKGGSKGAEKQLLGIEQRRKAFLNALAKKLSALRDAGHVIKIGKGAGSTGAELAQEDIFEHLQNNIQEMAPPGTYGEPKIPCIVWSVDAGAEGSFDQFASLSGYTWFGQEYNTASWFRTVCRVNDAQIKELRSLNKSFAPKANKTNHVSNISKTQSAAVLEAVFDIACLGYFKDNNLGDPRKRYKDLLATSFKINFTKVLGSRDNTVVLVPYEKVREIFVKHGWLQ